MPAIQVYELRKAYGPRQAVKGISFTMEPGEIFALLGPNGAGKTTTIEILEGYRRPDGGKVSVLNLDPIGDGPRLKARIGVMLQEPGLYPTITPREALELFAHFYPRARRPGELLDLVGLAEAAGTRYRQLSGGQKKRLALALALVGYPELVFLDEPTAGLDPQARRITGELIQGLKGDGISVLLTTHYLEEAERLADRVAIIHEGEIALLGKPEELIRGNKPAVRLKTASAGDDCGTRRE
jgi:ABC-2 type transport system ATP-binding protein